jgi:hypothetical protein
LATYVLPQIGKTPVTEVSTAQVVRILEPMWRTRSETARRVRGRIETILDWATAHGLRDGANPARFRGHLDKLLPRQAGLPQEVDIWLSRSGEVEAVANEIIDGGASAADRRFNADERRRQSANTRLAELNTLAYVLVAWHAKSGLPTPPIVLTALTHLLGLISVKGRPSPATAVLKRLGLPTSMRKIETFLEAAKLDGEAQGAGTTLSVNALAKKTRIERATLRSWRTIAAYQRRKSTAAMAAAKAPSIYAAWNRQRPKR